MLPSSEIKEQKSFEVVKIVVFRTHGCIWRVLVFHLPHPKYRPGTVQENKNRPDGNRSVEKMIHWTHGWGLREWVSKWIGTVRSVWSICTLKFVGHESRFYLQLFITYIGQSNDAVQWIIKIVTWFAFLLQSGLYSWFAFIICTLWFSIDEEISLKGYL